MAEGFTSLTDWPYHPTAHPSNVSYFYTLQWQREGIDTGVNDEWINERIDNVSNYESLD